MKQVVEAARMAGAEDFIRDMPDGFDAELGPRGARISGGQQQRLALARALLRPTPVLVLDEATSMFDDVGEQALLERIEPAIEDRCLIIITHRPRMLELAQRVVRMRG
jgi:ABC-type bacteriocin/lantibiotic exporter with double-glycine peptidase domain